MSIKFTKSYFIEFENKNNIYDNIYINFFGDKNIDIFDINFKNINLNDYHNINSIDELEKYKNKLLLLYNSINEKNKEICNLKNLCILYYIIISKILNENYSDNYIIIEYLNKLIKNINSDFDTFDTFKTFDTMIYDRNIYNSFIIIIYICYNNLYKFNNNDMQNYYNFVLKNSNNQYNICHKILLGTILNSNIEYNIKYNKNLYNKEKFVKFSKLFNEDTFINFHDIKLIFNVLFAINTIYISYRPKKNFKSDFLLINLLENNIFEDNNRNYINFSKIINYYSEYIEDTYYFKYSDRILFLEIDEISVIEIINNLINNKTFNLEKWNIIYKSICNTKFKNNIMKILINYAKFNFDLDDIFYKNIFYIEYSHNLQTNLQVEYFFELLEFLIPKIKSFNILYNIFYYNNTNENLKKLYNLIDKKYFNQNIFELGLLYDNSNLIDYYIDNNLVTINKNNCILALNFNNNKLYNHIINNKYIITNNDLDIIKKINSDIIYINNYKNELSNIDVNLIEFNNDFKIKYNLNINNLDLKNDKNLINKAYFYNNYSIIQNKNYIKNNKEILQLVKKLSLLKNKDNIGINIYYFNKIVNYINNIKDTENKYNYILFAINNLHYKNKIINNFLIILKLFYIKFKIKPTIYTNLPECLFY